MIKTFLQFFESKSKLKTCVTAFGRVNPPTAGHMKLLSAMENIGKKERANDVRFYGSLSQDAKRNPLDHETKLNYLQKMAKNAGLRVAIMKGARSVNTVIKMLEDLSKEGFEKVVLVAGSDRIDEYRRFEKYALDFGIKEYEVVSAGDRDPDADGVTGLSASKMRAAVVNKDFNTFKLGVPDLSNTDAKLLYTATKKGMNIK